MKIRVRYEKNNGTHQVIVVATATREYAITYAEPFPTDEEIRGLWKEDRKAFRPYMGTL